MLYRHKKFAPFVASDLSEYLYMTIMQVDCECDDEDNCNEIKCKVDKDKAPDSEDVYFYCKGQEGSVRMHLYLLQSFVLFEIYEFYDIRFVYAGS